jgi:hypothetical protein
MGLGYLLLAVKSEQDNYLVGNPQFTFFKTVYRKHTNFALDNVFLNFVGETANQFGRKIYIDIPKNGDLMHRMYLVVDMESSTPITKIAPLAYSLIESIEIFVDGLSLDKHYGEWLQIWHELFNDRSKDLSLAHMISSHSTEKTNSLYIPLRFWFNNNVGLSLPLIALQNATIRIEVKFNSLSTVQSYCKSKDNSINVNQDISIKRIQMLTEYIHLDTEERRLFSSNTHQYLITQVQTSLKNPLQLFLNDGDESYEQIQHRVDLRFNLPVKELFWTIQDTHGYILDSSSNPTKKSYNSNGILQYNYWRNFTPGQDQLRDAILVLNGKDMTEELPSKFYRTIQRYQYHQGYGLNNIIDESSTTDPNIPNSVCRDLSRGSGIYSYSFALKPEEYQPSGSLNFTQLEKAQLKLRLYRDTDNFTKNGANNISGKSMNIYAINYNILKVASGQGGVLFTS